ncbi:Lpg1974 family pore-forming outer membrane protein [Stieleria varia]|uniref:Outer membrane protein beta-barrel domain-containing protein n=1 Tax=Stieleria varia TaxID=2528005 RepID=A0A5C6A3J5_9BACT|nr:Lpg1974 family pore-forming outer membrane protein [Stieleria varia]TWT93945.1 hypothetical protein Pla52n_57730 [Stieleria varia]
MNGRMVFRWAVIACCFLAQRSAMVTATADEAYCSQCSSYGDVVCGHSPGWNLFMQNLQTGPAVISQSAGNCAQPTSTYSPAHAPIYSPAGCPDSAPVVAPAYRPFAADLGGLYGGFEFLWMRASFDQNVALIIDPPVGNTLVPFDYGYRLSPRTWLGWESCQGGGFRATYFGFDHQPAAESVTAVAGATPVYVFVYGAGGNLSRNAQAVVGQTLTSQHELTLHALDLEATQRFRWHTLRGVVGGGVRLASIDQRLSGQVRDGAGALQEAVSNSLELSGAGPTLSLQLTRRVASSRLEIYGGLRGSLLMSETSQRIYEMKGAFTTELEDRATQREVLTSLDMAIGLQWTQPFVNHSQWFVRSGYEVQAWFDAGGPVDSHSTIGLDAISLALGLQF